MRNRGVFSGNYDSWAEARAASVGYDDASVLAKVVAATRDVSAGRAAWERDGVTFAEPAVNPDLLAVLREIAGAEGSRLDVADFGGALGSTWWQHRAALTDLTHVRWRVIEQAHYVAAGREFTDSVLTFHPTLADAVQDGEPSTVLLSGVLQYMENPSVLLEEAVRLGFRHIIIDRTAFSTTGGKRLVVQRPPAELGGAYPCWLSERGELLAPLSASYRLRREWVALDRFPRASFSGFHFERST
jgi:putative methyltransferase (TIGR04325 family)